MLVLLAADLPPLGDVAEEIVVAHMVQHLLIGDLAGLLIALGLTGPILQPLLARRPFSWLRVLGNPLVALPIWALNLYLWHLSVLYDGRARQPAAALRPARLLLHLRAGDVAAAGRPAAEAGLVRRRGDADLRRRRPAARGGARQRPDLVGHGALPRLRAGRGEVGDQPARRPGRGRQRDDDLDRDRHARAVHLAVLPRRQPQQPRSRSCSSSPTRTASTSTRRAPRARSPPARASACASGSSEAALREPRASSTSSSSSSEPPASAPRSPRRG